jgi:DNA-binding transcriptional LysR family regulator
MPELKQLRALRAVAQAGSFSAAAEELDYTQPAVSRIVASLERELGTILIDRDMRPVRLTDAGEAVVRHSEEVFQHLTTAAAEVQAIARVDTGSFSLGTFSSAGAAFVVSALREFREEHPGVRVAIAEAMPSALVRRLREGEFDVAVVFDFPQVGEDIGDGLELTALMDDPLDVVVPRAHPLAEANRVSFADLAEENWLLPDFGPESPSLRLIDRGCAKAGFVPHVVFRVNDCQMTLAMVAAGEGIAVLPRLMLHPEHRGVKVKPLAEDAPIRRIAAVRLPTRYLTPAAKRFLEVLRGAAEREAA